MKNYLIIVFFIPLFVFPQRADYTSDQEKYVDEILKGLSSQDKVNFEVFIETLNNALKKAPYHPDILMKLFNIYTYGLNDFNFVTNYCQQLDKDYLQNNQNILNEFCAYCYFLTDRYDDLLYAINLMDEQKDKDLYKALYYIYADDRQKGIEFAIQCIYHNYKTRSQYLTKKFIISRIIMDLYFSQRYRYLNEIITEHKDQLRTIELELEAFLLLIETAILNESYDFAEDLISDTIIRFPQFFKYMAIYKSVVYSKKGEDSEAIKAMEKALNYDEDDFKVILNEKDGLNIFSNYILTLNNLNNYEDKVRLSEQMLDFFQGKELFSLKIKLYQSVLYASRDIEKAKAILNSCKEDITEEDYRNFNQLIKIQNQLYKENPDYKLVNQLLYNFKGSLSDKEFLMLTVGFKYSVNIEKNTAYFDATKMVEELDQLIEITNDEEQRSKYKLQKIQTISTYDLEKANRELDKLGIVDNDRLYYLDREFKEQKSNEENVSSDDVKGIKKFYNLNSMLIDFIMNVKINNQ